MNGGAPKPSALLEELQRMADLLPKMQDEEMPKSVFRAGAPGNEGQIGRAWSVRLEGIGCWPINSEQRGREVPRPIVARCINARWRYCHKEHECQWMRQVSLRCKPRQRTWYL